MKKENCGNNQSISTSNCPCISTIGYYINRALCSLIRRLNKELKEENLQLQHSHFSIMKIVSIREGLTQSELTSIIGKEKSGISRSMTFLEKEGYIERKALNGCTNRVFITEKGRNIIPVLDRVAAKVTNIAMTGFSEKKREDIKNCLTKIYENTL